MTKPASIASLITFRREVQRQVAERTPGVAVVWSSAKRITYPTGLVGFLGYFTVKGGGLSETVTYRATYDLLPNSTHTLSVTPL